MKIGGITTPELLNYSIPYFTNWKPDFIIVHSGINDTKSQLIRNNKSQLANLFIFKANIMIDRKKFKRVEKCLDKAKKYIHKNKQWFQY